MPRVSTRTAARTRAVLRPVSPKNNSRLRLFFDETIFFSRVLLQPICQFFRPKIIADGDYFFGEADLCSPKSTEDTDEDPTGADGCWLRGVRPELELESALLGG